MLDEAGVEELRRLLLGRDAVIKSYQQLELVLRGEQEALHARIRGLD